MLTHIPLLSYREKIQDVSKKRGLKKKSDVESDTRFTNLVVQNLDFAIKLTCRNAN